MCFHIGTWPGLSDTDMYRYVSMRVCLDDTAKKVVCRNGDLHLKKKYRPTVIIGYILQVVIGLEPGSGWTDMSAVDDYFEVDRFKALLHHSPTSYSNLVVSTGTM